jgi:hypothetical protein
MARYYFVHVWKSRLRSRQWTPPRAKLTIGANGSKGHLANRTPKYLIRTPVAPPLRTPHVGVRLGDQSRSSCTPHFLNSIKASKIWRCTTFLYFFPSLGHASPWPTGTEEISLLQSPEGQRHILRVYWWIRPLSRSHGPCILLVVLYVIRLLSL